MLRKNKLVIMRGVPGSGKSTLAKEIALDHLSCGGKSVAICATDDFHIVNGEYVFQKDQLGRFHLLNKWRVQELLKIGVDLVIVDNTNIKHQDMRTYKQFANQFEYDVEEIIVGEEYLVPGDEMTQQLLDGYADLCAKRNTHGVPLDVIKRMMREFQK